MAVPKKRTSRSKRDMRRSHHALKMEGNSVCKACGEVMRPHHVCSACGVRAKSTKK
ncbi:MAG: 50S ribosomal protein L32 [Alphaproteobacteria bacterium]|nr:MAG: 50S ribosomal protein L32 [Rickettsiaceae bacterium 4572_127]